MFLKGKFLFVLKVKDYAISPLYYGRPLIKDHRRDCPDRPTVFPSSIIPMQHRIGCIIAMNNPHSNDDFNLSCKLKLKTSHA
jgi:hypothetical protein